MQKIVVYGLPNCDSTQKAIRWLKSQNISFQFHDLKKDGITIGHLKKWTNKLPWQNILNKRGTTWRALPIELQSGVNDDDSAIKIMQEYSSTIKRPVVEQNDKLIVGFNEDEYSNQLLNG